MANIPIGGRLILDDKTPSIDGKYGPYNSIQEAYNTLSFMDVLCYGLTVGIRQYDDSIKEYWIVKIEGKNYITVDNFKEKFGTPTGGWTENDLDDSLKEIVNNVKNNLNPNIYKGISTTDANNSSKIVNVTNFVITKDRKPKNLVGLLLTLSKGHFRSKMYININNLGDIPVYYKGNNIIDIIEENSILYMIYETDTNRWNIINNPESNGVYWT